MKRWISLITKTFKRWNKHEAPRMGAALAFYTLLSLAPLLVLVAGSIALIFNEQRAHSLLIEQARQLIGGKGAETVQSLLDNAQQPSSGIFASLVAFGTLLFGASAVFNELRAALNTAWDVEPDESGGVWKLIRDRLFSFGMVFSVGFVLLVSLTLSAGVQFLTKYFGHLFPVPPGVVEVGNFLVSFVVVTLLFAMIYKVLPARRIEWRDVAIGSIGTALLFTAGKMLLAIYLGRASVSSPYGAAGSLVVVTIWIFYSAQIFFFGAEFTRVYSMDHLGKPTPEPKTATQIA